MADARKLHPEVETAIQRFPITMEITIAEVRAIAHLADAKAREEQRDEDAKVCDGYPQRDPAEDGNGYWAAQECATTIRRGKP